MRRIIYKLYSYLYYGRNQSSVFLTENKKTDADTNTRRVSQAVSRTQVVSTAGAVELGVSPPVDGGVS